MSAQPELPILRPTVPGKVRGIVALDPVVLQCGECGQTVEQPEGQRVAAFIILSGYRFHTCEPEPPRRCPNCLAAAVAACPGQRCKS